MLAQLRCAFFFLVLASTILARGQTTPLYGVDPGEAHAAVHKGRIEMGNTLFSAQWLLAPTAQEHSRLVLHPAEKELPLSPDLFIIKLADGKILRSTAMHIKDGPQIEELRNEGPDVTPPPAHTRQRGRQIVVRFEGAAGKLSVTWRGILKDGSNYLRQEISIRAIQRDVPIREVQLFDFNASSARVVGTVKGSPVTVGDVFFGFEHPLSSCEVDHAQTICSIARELPLRTKQTVTYSSVIGVSPAGQMRRGFLHYIECERARPYRPFLHYNSWYDIGFNNPYDEASALDVIRSFGNELVTKRGVKLDSFLFDDGWDDPHTLWSFGPGFPNGFAPLRSAAEKFAAEPGVWLSPWGGYDRAKEERLKYGSENGLETNQGGFALSGPKYFARFEEVTLKFIRDYGVNQFKIDGTGNVNSVLPGSQFDSDFQAAISLMREWRAANPEIFINLTTGTYPSPFWLQYADSIWRGDDDHSFAGVGRWRERWITFRDGATYRGVVQPGPLFPLNSLMLHGIIYARHAENLGADPQNDFANEVHSYFGSGTQLQEMYITHSLLSDDNWDTLAEAANWSRRNADVLVDTHWIGGDPNQLEVYGWAAWSPRMGILTLRNPSDKTQSYSLDVAQAFELPAQAPQEFEARTPWHQNADTKPLHLTAGKSKVFTLKPFEVLTLEASPQPASRQP
jgi:hypothetical protein